MGIANPSVLPEPVFDLASVSRPEVASSITMTWIENAGLPIPGETILLIAGYFAATGEFNIGLVMVIAAVGAVVGDNIGFAVGHHFGRAFLLRIGRYVFLTPERFAAMDKYFHLHGNKTIVFR